MPSDESVSRWVEQIKAGDRAAAQKLWERYFQRLVGLARTRLRGRDRRVADEEDAALSAFDSFCRGAERGRFPNLHDRDDLWRLLVTITSRKALQLARYQGRQKRGGNVLMAVSGLSDPDSSSSDEDGLQGLLAKEPTPEFAAEVAEEYERLLAKLPISELQKVAVCKMEGYSNAEIAEKLGCAVRSVERKLQVIRSLWDPVEGTS